MHPLLYGTDATAAPVAPLLLLPLFCVSTCAAGTWQAAGGTAHPPRGSTHDPRAATHHGCGNNSNSICDDEAPALMTNLTSNVTREN